LLGAVSEVERMRRVRYPVELVARDDRIDQLPGDPLDERPRRVDSGCPDGFGVTDMLTQVLGKMRARESFAGVCVTSHHNQTKLFGHVRLGNRRPEAPLGRV